MAKSREAMGEGGTRLNIAAPFSSRFSIEIAIRLEDTDDER